MTCPVSKTIDTIYSSGLYNGGNDDDNDNNKDNEQNINQITIKSNVIYINHICDDVAFFTNVALMEFARFQLKKPTTNDYEQYYKKLARSFETTNANNLLACVIKRSSAAKLLKQEIIKLLIQIDLLEQFITEKLAKVSINKLTLPSNIFKLNNIIEFMNKLQNKIGPSGREKWPKIEPLNNFGAIQLADLKVPTGDPQAKIEAILENLAEVTKYAIKLEIYMIESIKKILEIMTRITEIMK